MKRFFGSLLVSSFCLASVPALAADVMVPSSLPDALASSTYQQLINGDVKFFYGAQRHPKVVEVIGTWKSVRRKSQAGNPTQACHIAFANAAYELQKRAEKVGGNAVIAVVSLDKAKEQTKSQSQYICRVGSVMTAVTLEGQIVRTK